MHIGSAGANAVASMRVIRWLVVAVTLLSCNDLTGPLPVEAPAPRHALVDARSGGSSGFYFLPPIAPATSYAGQFDPARSPVVEICKLGGAESCVTTIATFALGSGSMGIRVDTAAQQYIVNWHAGQYGVVAGETYRASVTDGGLTLGYADIRIVRKGSDAKSVPSGFAALVANATLPVKFRIEMSTLGLPVTSTIGTNGGRVDAIVGGGGRFTLDVPAGALTSPVEFTVIPQPSSPGGYGKVHIRPANILFKKPVSLKFTIPGASASAVDSVAIAIGTPSVPRSLILPGSAANGILTANTPFLGSVAPIAPNVRLASTQTLGLQVIADDVSEVEATIATVQERIDVLNAKAQQLEATRSFTAAMEARIAALSLAQLIDDSDLAETAMEGAETAACSWLESDIGLSESRLGSDVRNLWEALRPMIAVYSFHQLFGVLEANCPLSTKMDSVITERVEEFTVLAEAALQGPGFPQNAPAVARELYKIMSVTGFASQILGLENLFTATITPRVQIPIANMYRRGSYDWCRTNEEQTFLGYLFRSARDSKLYHPVDPDSVPIPMIPENDLGMTAGVLWRDVQLCGTRIDVRNVKESGEATEHGPLGGLDDPGFATVSETITINPHGSLELDGLLIALRCTSEVIGNDRIAVRFNGRHVRYLDRVGPTAHFIRNAPIVLSVDELADSGRVDLEEGGTFPLQLLRQGNECNGEYNLPSEITPNVLVTLNLVYPKIVIDVDPESVVEMTPAENREFTAVVTGTDNTDVIWNVRGPGDWQVSGNRLFFSAPEPDEGGGAIWIIARSVVDPARADSTEVQLIGPECPGAGANVGLAAVSECIIAVSISPKTVTLAIGDSVDFSAIVTGSDDQGVSWNAEGGSINSNGRYIAGNTSGQSIVTVTADASPFATDQAVVTILPPPTVAYGGTGNRATARATTVVVNGGNSIFDFQKADTTATGGTTTATAVKPLVANPDGTTAQANAEGIVGMNLSFGDLQLTGGSANGSIDGMAMANGPAGGQNVLGAMTAFSTFSIEFSPTAPVRLQFTVDAPLTGLCATTDGFVSRGNLNVTYGRKGGMTTESFLGGGSVTKDLVIGAGAYVLAVNINCTLQITVQEGGGTKSGGGSFNTTFTLEPP